MNAIGMIETYGLIPAIEAADIMLKIAQVAIVERSNVGSGIVTVTVTGDVGAIKSAIDAGASAVQGFGSELLLSQHVIPRPSDQVAEILMPQRATVEPMSEPDRNENQAEEKASQPKIEPAKAKPQKVKEEKEETVEKLNLKELSVKELRKLAKEYDNLGMTEEELQTATRAALRDRFEEYLKK